MSQTWINKELVEKAKKENIKLVFDRFEEQQPQCIFGEKGVCCKVCHNGPCRIIPGKQDKGICGASADTIVARNLLRHVSAGAACHVDHARENVLVLYKIGRNLINNYKITDEKKLRQIAKRLGKNPKASLRKVSESVALEGLEDFRRHEGMFHRVEGNYLNWLKLHATRERINLWEEIGVTPINSDAEISHAFHQTSLGCDADPKNILLSVLMNGIVDGYGGMHLSTDMQDILFGTPSLVKSYANLGVIKEDYVNIAVHGHVPLLSEKIVEWAKKLNKEAEKVGAKGINVVGICCTGNEVLMRHGIPLAAHTMQSEMAIVTGALEAMVTDTQCIYPSLQDVASCYHTKLITTLSYVRIPNALHIPFTVEEADKTAKEIIMTAVENFKNRAKSKVYIPNEKSEVFAGFSAETIIELLRKLNNNNPLKPLVDNIKNGNIMGIAAVIGCRNAKLKGQKFGEQLIRELIKNNILVVTTGCMAHAAAQDNLMNPSAVKYAGSGLKKFLEEVGKANGFNALPPVLHMGSCVDTSRIETLLNAIAKKLNLDLPKLPVVASAPEYVAEKALAIAVFSLALGITTHLNPMPPISGSKFVTKFLTKDLENLTGAKVLLAETPETAAKEMIEVIKAKRKNL